MINIKSDSREIKPGDTFVAIKGATVDGHDYIEKAIEKGATKIVAEHGEYSVETKIVKSTKDYLIEYMSTTYQDILKDIKIVGITGTNGKTTTTFIVYQMLNKLGEKCAYIGTNGFFIAGEYIRELPNTTLDIISTYLLIEEAKNNGVTTIAMEVSSHALEEQRIAGITFDIGAFTNLTQDHLDFHGTMENYLESKVKLLGLLKENGKMIVNADDPHYEGFSSPKTLTIGNNGSDYKFNNYVLGQGTTDISFSIKDKEYSIQTNFTGEFNVYNFVMAVAIVNEMGYKIDDIIETISGICPPKGRCQTIHYNEATIVVDFAHTPDAMEKIIDCFKSVQKKKLITLIGCGGDRDPVKRPIMGRIASVNSDYVIYTNDNPRTEDEEKIMDDILTGVERNNYEVIFNRREAIAKGISLLEPEDIFLILGKGHETNQIIGHEHIHFDDAEVVEEIINS